MQNWPANFDLQSIKALINLGISFFSGFLIGATEIISTFQYRRKLFRMASVILLLSLYGLLGLTAFLILTYQDAAYWGNTLAALAAGVCPHVILRSRFSILRSRDESGEKKLDLSLDLEKVFNTWVKFFKNRIDVIYLQDQRDLIDRLIRRFPTTQAMRLEATKLLYSRQALEAEDRKSKLADVEAIFEDAKDMADEICLHRLADLIVRVSDFDTLNNRLKPAQEIKQAKVAPSSEEATLLNAHPNLLDRLDEWQSLLSDKEQEYLEQKILSSSLTNIGKARAAAKFLVSRKKLKDVLARLRH